MNDNTKLPEDFKKKWVAALRSGEYKQCKQSLHDTGGHCCLGVAELILGLEPTKDAVLRHDSVPLLIRWSAKNEEGETVGLRRSVINGLTEMNDKGKTFSEIADYIEANL